MALVASEAGCSDIGFPFSHPQQANEEDSSEGNNKRCADILACQGGGGGAGGQPPPPPQCVPDDGQAWAAEVECGVFVSVKGDDDNSGTPDEPVKTFGRAIELALAEPQARRIYACAGDDQTFIEQVVVPETVTIFGGLDCTDGWKWTETKTKLTAGEGQIPLKMRGTGTVHLEDLHVVAAPAEAQVADGERKGDGLSSIAAIADGMKVELERCELEAGGAARGADGLAYDDSPGNELAAPKGDDGRPGADACSEALVTPGGAGVTNDCGMRDDSDVSTSGKGGFGDTDSGGAGNEGYPTTARNDEPNRGRGEAPSGNPNCGPGGRGDTDNDGMPFTAEPGTPGTNAPAIGAISSDDGYTGTPGANGGPGAPGRGGGGGGGARGITADETSRRCPGISGEARPGASGGSGGAGGCGGNGGRGGRPGGSSIALVSINATLSFEEVTLRAGRGGDGGDGSFGQDGGPGGMGGPGGNVPAGSIGLDPACAGGRGGPGGTGGRGAGGQGGHSLGIAFRDTDLPANGDIEGVKITPGQPGLGGAGGQGDPVDGAAAKALPFPQ
ncbi:hypothetical protein ACMHYB_12035 [Sorangium sp. So ce1128]